MGCIGKCCFGITAAVGIVAVILGVSLGWGIGPAVVKSMVHDTLDLTDEGSDGYINFIVPPVAPRMKFYFFEVVNYEELIDGNARDGRPFLKERGPYTFREDREKKELNWTDSMEYLAFGQYKSYTFLPDESCDGCKSTDEVRILNMPAASFIAKVEREVHSVSAGVYDELNTFFNEGKDELFKSVVVEDFLFNGIDDGIVDFLYTDELIETLVKKRLPDVFRENGFALFNGKVNTSEKECYEVATGELDWDMHTVITKYGKDMDSLWPDLSKSRSENYFEGTSISLWWPYRDENGNTLENSSCNALKGTDGAQFPPGVKKSDTLWIFNTLPCRSLFFNFQEKVKIEGINTLEFGVPLDGANINKTMNVCACEELSAEVWKMYDEKNTTESCVKLTEDDTTLDLSDCPTSEWRCYDGVQDISNCQGAPTYMSYPHFYLADEQRAMFDGLEPVVEDHRTYLDVEPYTGMTLKIHTRIQLNTPLYNLAKLQEGGFGQGVLGGKGEFDVLKNLNYFPTFPFLWLDLTASIDMDEEQIDKLKKELVTPLLLLNVFSWVLIGVGIALTALGSVQFICKK